MQPLAAGQRIGRHRLIHRLGVGSFGEVWLVHTATRPPRAMKMSPLRDPADAQRFRLEFEKLRPLQLPHVVRVHETGVDGGYAWFTMDVAHGVPMHTWVQSTPELKERVRRVCQAGAQVARGLAAIHRVGLAHRDLKPANIHIDDDGRATLLDFGTARFGATGESSSAMMGTIPYMAPEQRVGLPHDLRVDTYSLGATLHESLSGIPAGKWRPGRPRPSLARLGADVPLALARLVDRLLHLDPAARPTADEVASLLDAITDGAPLPPVPWPSPTDHYGDATRLMSKGPYAVVGPLGSGRKRLILEARWQWYRKGYRSVAARCVPDRPYAALCDILEELFRSTVSTGHRELAGADAAILKAVWPSLPVQVAHPAPWPPDPAAVGASVARVLGRNAPLAVALFDVDEADAGTAAVIPELLRTLPSDVLVWATSSRPVSGFRQIRPPPWVPASEREVLPSLLPDGVWPQGPAGRTPLESCARAWRSLARWRGQPGPVEILPGDPVAERLQALAVLDEPFPAAVASQLVDDLPSLIAQGHLQNTPPPSDAVLSRPASESGSSDDLTESTDFLLRHVLTPELADDPDSVERIGWLRFSDPGTRLLARATGASISDRERRSVLAWASTSAGSLHPAHRTLAMARHEARGRSPRTEAFAAAAQVSLERGDPVEVDRWLQLYALHGGDREDWFTRFARASVDLDLDPGRVQRPLIEELGRTARTNPERARAALLLLRFELNRGRTDIARTRGSTWALQLDHPLHHIAGQMRREVAEAALAEHDFDTALREAEAALDTARPEQAGASLSAPSLAEVDAACTLARSHLARGDMPSAEEVATRCLDRCTRTGRSRGESRLAVILAESALVAGHHSAARDYLARCRTGRSRTHAPVVKARATSLEAQIAVEMGDPTAARILIAEGQAVSAAHGRRQERRDLATLALELAVHTANADLARHARIERATASCNAPGDHWPATLARWRWLTGDLQGALGAASAGLDAGLPSITARAEHSRLLLIAGRYPEARTSAARTAAEASRVGMEAVACFARLVEGAAGAWSDHRYLPVLAETRRARWVHLYLGGLHLDAIRRQLRGDDARPVLEALQSGALAIGHQLYTAISRPDGW